ncbi:MAG: TIM barrel protein [Thermodesulfobacteriota bacterium]
MPENESFYTLDALMKRQSISTVVYWKYRPVDGRAFEELAKNGITQVELLESPDQFDMTHPGSMKYIGDAARACGVRIIAYHANMTHFSHLDTETQRTARVDICKRQIDTLVDLGGTLWGTHARETDDTLLACYSELARYVEGTGVVLLIENFKDEGLWVEDRVSFLDRLGHPQVGMILDIGHVRNGDGANPMTVPGGPARIIGMCRRHLLHLHLHGFKNGEDHFPPLCEGDTIQWLELFRMLYAVGYPGPINFEPKGEPKHRNAVEATAGALERIVALEGGTEMNR